MGPEREWWSVKGVDEATPIFAQVATVGEGESLKSGQFKSGMWKNLGV